MDFASSTKAAEDRTKRKEIDVKPSAGGNTKIAICAFDRAGTA